MQPSQRPAQPAINARETNRQIGHREFDRLELLAAACETEDTCALWIADQLSSREEVRK